MKRSNLAPALAIAILGLSLVAQPAAALNLSHLPDAKSHLPKDAVKLSGVVPGMGEHWGNPKDMPLGPIYCVFEGKIICLEFMISQKDFVAGKSYSDLHGVAGLPPVDHVNIGFEPHGHEGYKIPHYDLHFYFLPPAELAEVK